MFAGCKLRLQPSGTPKGAVAPLCRGTMHGSRTLHRSPPGSPVPHLGKSQDGGWSHRTARVYMGDSGPPRPTGSGDWGRTPFGARCLTTALAPLLKIYFINSLLTEFFNQLHDSFFNLVTNTAEGID